MTTFKIILAGFKLYKNSIRANDTRNLHIQVIFGSSYLVTATPSKSYHHEVGNPTFAYAESRGSERVTSYRTQSDHIRHQNFSWTRPVIWREVKVINTGAGIAFTLQWVSYLAFN